MFLQDGKDTDQQHRDMSAARTDIYGRMKDGRYIDKKKAPKIKRKKNSIKRWIDSDKEKPFLRSASLITDKATTAILNEKNKECCADIYPDNRIQLRHRHLFGSFHSAGHLLLMLIKIKRPIKLYSMVQRRTKKLCFVGALTPFFLNLLNKI